MKGTVLDCSQLNVTSVVDIYCALSHFIYLYVHLSVFHKIAVTTLKLTD